MAVHPFSIEGFEEAESDEIIDELETNMLQAKAMYTHKWRLGDLVIQDNRCSYHKAAGDYPPEGGPHSLAGID